MILSFYDELHRSLAATFSDLSPEELALQVYFWEDEALPVEFRLHRYASHLRQHSVQVERILASLGHEASEAQMLLRLIFFALGQVEGVLIGVGGLGAGLVSGTAAVIDQLTGELEAVRQSTQA